MADESEEACLVNPKSPLNCGQMSYTDGVNSASSASITANLHSLPQTKSATTHHRGHNSTAANSYDLNDDIILSQFHADAIKQVTFTFYVLEYSPFLNFCHYIFRRDVESFNLLPR